MSERDDLLRQLIELEEDRDLAVSACQTIRQRLLSLASETTSSLARIRIRLIAQSLGDLIKALETRQSSPEREA